MSEESVHESREPRSRQGPATYLRWIARALRRAEPVPADDAGTVTVDPAATGDAEVELEREDAVVNFEIEMEWPEEGAEIGDEAAASKATFELYADTADQFRWRLRHDNGNIIADGGEGYADKRDTRSGIESVQRNAPGAHVVDVSRDEEAPEEGVATPFSSCSATTRKSTAGGSSTTTGTSSPTADRGTPRGRRRSRGSAASDRTRPARPSRSPTSNRVAPRFRPTATRAARPTADRTAYSPALTTTERHGRARRQVPVLRERP